jgi:pimeloyl-ACP methyl ester carboxylesterase
MTISANDHRSSRRVDHTRIFTPARITALALIAALAVGLAYLRFPPETGSMTVPAGAQAGDLSLQPCSYATEHGPYAADCGTLVVPENRADPASRLIALPLTRIKATSPSPGEPVFYLEGGPGLSNMAFPQASRFADDRDVVLVGYRGVDGSVRLDCPEVAAAVKQATDLLGEQHFRDQGDAYRACANRLTNAGVDLTEYGLPQQVDDLEAARLALGYDRVNLLSQSAGTRTAMIYAWRYPERIHRSVMIGVNPPGHYLYDTPMVDEQIARYAALCAQDATCRTRTDDLAASMRRTVAAMPERWLVLPIKASNVRVVTFFGMAESTPMLAPPSAPLTLDAWLSAAAGDNSAFWMQSIVGDFFPWPFVWGQYAAAASIDAGAVRDAFSAGGQDRTSLGWVGSAFAWGGGRLADDWPTASGVEVYSRARTSQVETLLISGALDTATPPQAATQELLPFLPNGHQAVLPGVGHIGSFFAEQPAAGRQLINAFFASGRVDDSLYQPQQVYLTPATTLGTLARFVAGSTVVLALLTVFSLLWMRRRVHQRGGFGRVASALLRSLHPLVLGLGGWCLGALLTMPTLPGVRLDAPLLVALSTGVPIGLGLYLAWVHDDRSAKTRNVGFVAAAGGALVGAGLGVNAADGLMAPLTAIVGAAVGGNLTLLALDIARDRSVHDESATANTNVALEARPAIS